MIATIPLKPLCIGRLACSIVFPNPATTVLQPCYNLRIVACWKNTSYFAWAVKVFCVCPQGVLRVPARCFAQARKVARCLLAPCAKACCTLSGRLLYPIRRFFRILFCISLDFVTLSFARKFFCRTAKSVACNLTFGKTQINLVFRSLIRTFADVLNSNIYCRYD